MSINFGIEMKNFLLVILAAFYLVISIGFINYNVYCQNRLMKTSLVVNNLNCDKCPNCTQKQCKKDGSCCKHSKEHLQLKVDQNHNTSHIEITPQQIEILSIFLSGYITPDANTISKETYPVTNAPPLGAQNPIHILNCTYLI